MKKDQSLWAIMFEIKLYKSQTRILPLNLHAPALC